MFVCNIKESEVKEMKKPESMSKATQGSNGKKSFKDFWANKSTRWTVIAFLAMVGITIAEFVFLAVK